ncbi:rhamnogalacturonan acetylesterase [Paenibacillus mucilaginosus]|uniref:rhamnogalacturonan acetylesterase n=1 Tax=Paenibacillus mucilaginosus TaxID=61624 RepID=UPI003D190CA8
MFNRTKPALRALLSLTLAAGLLLAPPPGGTPATQAAGDGKLYKFDFGPGTVAAGYTAVPQTAAYSASLGYGFADPAKVTSRDRGTADPLRSDFAMPAGTPFLVDVPNGDYRVSLISGDAIASSSTVVSAEGASVATLSAGAGQYAEQTVNVNVRDGQLTLNFTGTVPRINAIEVSRIYKFDFGPGAVETGYTGVLQTAAYSAAQGYGFGDVTKVGSRDRGTPDALRSDFVMPAGTPFQVDVPNGTYDVSILTGDAIGRTSMDVRAEGLLQLYSFGAPEGQFLEEAFPITVTDGRLTLDFSTTTPHLNALVITRRPDAIKDNRITVFLAGDSTVSNYNRFLAPQAGWGQMLPNYLNGAQVVVDNQAKRGRSSKSYYDEGSLDTILSRMKANDYLFIMFGINDSATDTARRTEPSTTFKEYLTKYIDAARAKGAIPVLVTSQSKRTYDASGVFTNSIGGYPQAMRELGAAVNVPVIDLNAKSIAYYNSIGVEATKDVFMWLNAGESPNYPSGASDNVHFQEYGAGQLARLVAEGIKEKNLHPLAQHVK